MTPQPIAEPRRGDLGRPHRHLHLRSPDLAARPGLRPVAPRQLGHHLPATRPRIRPPRERRPRVTRDDELLEPGTCGHRVSIGGSGFYCTETGDHDEHVWRGEAQASRGLGYRDNLSTELEVRWRDSRPAATVGDVRRALAGRGPS